MNRKQQGQYVEKEGIRLKRKIRKHIQNGGKRSIRLTVFQDVPGMDKTTEEKGANHSSGF